MHKITSGLTALKVRERVRSLLKGETIIKKHRLTFLFAGLFLLVVMPFLNQAAATAISTFGSGIDGWIPSDANVSWAPSIGNPAGSLYSVDINSNWAQVIAPSKFYVTPWESSWTVRADINAVITANAYPVAFGISDGNTWYQHIFATNPDNTWQTFSVTLESSNWERVTTWVYWPPPSGGFGTESLATVLQNVNTFHILTDYAIGSGEEVYLDNIAVGSAVPIPPSLVLLGSGLLGLGGWRRFRKN